MLCLGRASAGAFGLSNALCPVKRDTEPSSTESYDLKSRASSARCSETKYHRCVGLGEGSNTGEMMDGQTLKLGLAGRMGHTGLFSQESHPRYFEIDAWIGLGQKNVLLSMSATPESKKLLVAFITRGCCIGIVVDHELHLRAIISSVQIPAEPQGASHDMWPGKKS
jgi:hypothetical protein